MALLLQIECIGTVAMVTVFSHKLTVGHRHRPRALELVIHSLTASVMNLFLT